MENEFLDKVEDNAIVRIRSEKVKLEKGDNLAKGYVSELWDYTRWIWCLQWRNIQLYYVAQGFKLMKHIPEPRSSRRVSVNVFHGRICET
ncbi:hypothetical protein Gotur_027797 [Gossypium turneri]